MNYKVAGSLLRLRDQLDTGASTRSKASDGTIGNAEHAARDSDHNPWWVYGGVPYVTAMDITHDPAGGLDCQDLEWALWAGRDPRIKYVIWNKQIMAGTAGPEPWQSRPYHGADPHTNHLHLSVMPNAGSLLQADWNLFDLFPMEDDVKADEVWGFPVHDLYTTAPTDTLTAGVAVEWAAANAGHAKDMAEAALKTSQRCEEKLDQVLAMLGGQGNKTL